MKWLRTAVDLGVIATHAAAIAIAVSVFGVGSKPSGQELIAVAGIAITFHLAYIFWYATSEFFEMRNLAKWAEYSITASLAALAVGNSGDQQLDDGSAMAIFLLGTFQMSCGAVIDNQLESHSGLTILRRSLSKYTVIAIAFGVAVLCQTCEALLVYNNGSPPDSLFVVYITTYSLFGVWAALTILFFSVEEGMAADSRKILISEVGYSILGVGAKASILLVYGATLE